MRRKQVVALALVATLTPWRLWLLRKERKRARVERLRLSTVSP